ncbi:pecanex protein [Ancylostoma caninum]|uniref:Pecanex-like protein n=1 Tax=Ancylostoma caninum TaxID=29170 RepID=A0A368FR93_ANCCA|nr:pecanex protein [Ancylostoma caninum]
MTKHKGPAAVAVPQDPYRVVTGKYIIDGYSITDNSAVNLLQVHELRRLLVTLYVKCIVYYALASNKLQSWLANETVRSTLDPIVANPRYADVDHLFCSTNDEDFDMNEMGISRSSFTEWYSLWISHCIHKRTERNTDEELNSDYITCLCFLLSLLGRRALGAASYNRHSNAAESFLCGLHALFKGDFRITCQRDEWVFADMDLLRCVISPAVKMALKLHQFTVFGEFAANCFGESIRKRHELDHFAASDDFDDPESLYDLIAEHQTKLFISHEHDPAWRRAIIANTPSLLALRHMYDEGQDDYKIIMLNRMHLNMRVIKLNRECVRAFWAGQQQELIFLRNRNPERGSIQNARQVFRYLNEPLKSTGEPLVVWPSEEIRQISGRNSWYCQPMEGLMGRVMFTWHPNHPNRKLRSHIGDAIHLVAIPEMTCALVPVSEKGCSVLPPEKALELQSGENRKASYLFHSYASS